VRRFKRCDGEQRNLCMAWRWRCFAAFGLRELHLEHLYEKGKKNYDSSHNPYVVL